MIRFIYFLLLSILLSFLFSCKATKSLQKDQLLYNDAEIKYEGNKPNVAALDLYYEIRQKPNSRFLIWPIELGIYNLFRNSEKGLGKWLRNTLGEPPVIYDPGKSKVSSEALKKKLKDEGYLQSRVSFDTIVKKQKARVVYKVKAGERYQLKEVNWPTDTTQIGQMVQSERQGSVLIPGQPYRTELLSNERQRLSKSGLEKGFYGLNADVFYYFLDTTKGDHEVRAYLRIAEKPSGSRLKPYCIGKTSIYPTYVLGQTLGDFLKDTLVEEGFTFIQAKRFVQSKRLRNAILQREGELFQQSLQQKSINRLLALGPFKFVNLEYRLRKVEDSLFLDRVFYLTPGLTQDFSVELETSTLSTASSSLDFGLNITYTHRNIFRGAEQLQIRFSAGASTQLGSNVDFINSVNLSLENRLSIPGLVGPFKLLNADKFWQSSTNILLSGEFQRRTNFFTLASVRTQFGYEWRPGPLHRFQFFPVQFTLVNLISRSAVFQRRLDRNPRLEASFDNYVIIGSLFQLDYSEEKPGERENFFAFSMELEPAGNVAKGLSDLFASSADQPYKVFGVPFAQFICVEGELRRHWYQRHTALATRFRLGIALPYGNVDAVPYVRQFFVGGSNSIRAWQIRALGPGAVPVETFNAEVFQDQTGDILLEANLEYRFPIFSYLKGAIFADAGNIWLTSQGDDLVPEAVFSFDRFYDQLAVGGGLGLRLDVTYFVLRFDVAFPLRKPYNALGNRWVLDEISLGDPNWRRDNLVYNLALGYPF